MNEKYTILTISVNTCIKTIGKKQIFLIAITTEIGFVTRDNVEVYEFTWHYSTRLWERLGGARWKFRRKVTPLRSYESDPLFRWKVTP